jgi:hypothetical protein
MPSVIARTSSNGTPVFVFDPTASALPVVKTDAAAFYDDVMAEIEPDLVSANIPGLQDKYQGETPQQAQERAERYERAFQAYDRRLDAYEQATVADARAYARDVRASVESDDRQADEPILDDIASQIAHL